MNALPYLSLTILKNKIIAFFKKPANVIVLLLMVALIGMMVFAGNHDLAQEPRPMEEVYAILTALYMLVFALMAYNGIDKGASLFSLPDIHLAFTAPIMPRSILFYGLTKQMGTSLMLGYFILFQYSWIHQLYHATFGFLFLVILGYAITMFLGQFTAMALYASSSGKPKRRMVYKVCLLGLCALAVAFAILPPLVKNDGSLLPHAVAVAGSWPMLLFPVAGWMRTLVQGLWSGNMLYVLMGTLPAALLLIGLILYLGRVQTDFYEDVLAITEQSHQAVTARREGKLQENLPAQVKLGKTGIAGGWGASAFYYKHRLESRRGKRFVLDNITLIYLVVNLVFTFIIREAGFLFAFLFATYMQLFSVTTGRWIRELLQPYIYLVPETPFKKLIQCLRESIAQYALEAMVLMVPMGLICGLTPVEILLAVAARFVMACLFVAGNLMVDRFFGTVRLKMLVLLLYLFVMLLLMAPAIVLSILLPIWGIMVITPVATVLLTITLTGALLTPLCLYLCRNMLANAELSGTV